jgi:hypothetical protein
MYGMGGGGAPEVFSAEAPAATEEAAAATEAPAVQEPPAELVPLPTATLDAAGSAPVEVTPSAKERETTAQDQAQVQNVPETAEQVPPPVPTVWLGLLAAVAVLGALIMVTMRRLAAERWRQRSK